MRAQVLIVDDEPNMRRTLEILLGEDDRLEVATAASAEKALERLAREPADLVLTDLTMPGMDGLELLRRVRESSPETQVVLMTAYQTVESALAAMRAGAFEYLIKPFAPEELVAIVEAALKQGAQVRETRRLRAALEAGRFGDLVGTSEAMRRIFHTIERAAETDATVLITGESGTGKGLVARAVHYRSKRADGPFVAVNVAALAPSLAESELFGHERGAFTGAVKTRIGRLEQADGGTLFLDEIGELPPALQTKLLTALQEKTFERVGGSQTLRTDLRVIAATNRDLEKAIADGSFREDLYYRLHVVTIAVPPLRERREDIPLLVEHFLGDLSRKLEGPPKALSAEAREALETYDFPGNVRELANILERASILAEGAEIQRADLPIGPRGDAKPQLGQFVRGTRNGWVELQAVIKELERQLCERALAEHGHLSNEEIASLLGTSRRVFELRLAEFGLQKRK